MLGPENLFVPGVTASGQTLEVQAQSSGTILPALGQLVLWVNTLGSSF